MAPIRKPARKPMGMQENMNRAMEAAFKAKKMGVGVGGEPTQDPKAKALQAAKKASNRSKMMGI